MSILKTLTPDQRARLALGLLAQQARTLADACQRASEGGACPADMETITDVFEATLKQGATRHGLLLTQDQEADLFPVFMMWLFPECADVQARWQKYLAQLDEAEQEGGQEAQEGA